MQDAGRRAEVAAGGPVAAGGGAVRYRVWPARSHPWRGLGVASLAAALIAGGAVVLGDGLWTAVLALGVLAAAAAFFFPTEVVVAGGQLVVRQLGVPRSYALADFTRVTVVRDVTTRLELSRSGEGDALEAVRTVAVPLPDNEDARRHVLASLEAARAETEDPEDVS
jgi:hypothetical protein